MRQTYDGLARKYRDDDERHVGGLDHQRLCETLGTISVSFMRPISVLDLGCGTGRHFHCFRNVRRLVGVDVSREMLREAERPVCASEVEVERPELICSDLYSVSFPEESFDLIVCLGVFGNGCDITGDLLRRWASWLTGGGILLLDTFDPSSLPLPSRIRKYIRWKAHIHLPQSVRSLWIKRTGWPPCFYCTESEIRKMLLRSALTNFSIDRVRCHMPAGPAQKFFIKASR